MKQLHPRAIWLFLISSLTFSFFLFLVFGFWMIGLLVELADDIAIVSYLAISLALVIFLIIFSYVWARLSYRFYKYELKENGFYKESGVIWKKYVTIPYDRIQNVDINRGVWARILGLSDLNIQTAGASSQGSSRRGSGAEGRLPGLLHADAEKLRDELINRAKQSNNQGL